MNYNFFLLVYVISYAFRHLAIVDSFFFYLCVCNLIYYALIVILTRGKTWCILK